MLIESPGLGAPRCGMQIQDRIFDRLPIARKLLVIVGVFVGIVLCVTVLGALRSDILTGVRAYVGGEGLWSKAEKQAVLSLTKYSVSHDENDYQRYLAEIAVPEGDKQARLQLSSPAPDMEAVYKGFEQGRNHHDDVQSMANLFRRFGRIGYMARAIAIWTEGDRNIDRLRSLAEELHAEVSSAHPDAHKVQQISDQISVIDARLTPLEDAFSSTLSAGARWINRVLSAIVLAATAVLLLIGILLSIAVLNQIRDSEEKYRNLINTANDAILVIDAQSRLILEANSKACEMLRVSENELVGRPESQLYHVRAKQSEDSTPLTIETARGQELELLRSDGTHIPVEVSASKTDLGGKPAVLGIFRDIRDRREAAAILRLSEERFSHLIQNLSDVITVVAVDNTMVYQSPSVERVVGYQPSMLLGKSFLSFVHPQDQASVRAALEQVTLKTGTAVPPEFRFHHRDGSWVCWSPSPTTC